MDDYRNGDVKIELIQLISLSGNKKLSLRGQVQYIDLFESILQPVIWGEVVVMDAVDILRQFPIIGEETLRIKFSTPNQRVVDASFSVVAVNNFVTTSDGKTNIYTLKICSTSILYNLSTTINHRFNQPIDKSITDILNNQLHNIKPVVVAPVRGIDNYLITNKSPFEAIDMLRLRSISPKYPSSSFVLFESFTDYQFTTIEQLFEEGLRKNLTKFTNGVNIRKNVDDNDFRAVIAWQQIQESSVIDVLRYGGIASTVRKFDINTGKALDLEFNVGDAEDKFTKTGSLSKTQTSRFIDKFGLSGPNHFVPFAQQDNSDVVIAEKQQLVAAFAEKITQNLARAAIYGDSSLLLGSMISVKQVRASGLDQTAVQQKLTSQYLVSKIRHCISISARPTYIQSLELINNSYAK